MTTIIGNTTDYIIERENTETNDVQQMTFVAYNGTFTITQSADTATRYTDLAKAQKNVDFQNMMAEFNELPYKYYVVKRVVDYTKVD